MGFSRRQEAFIREYALDHNATQAAIRAGYSPKTAKQQGSRLLKNPEISQAIEKADEERRQQVGVEVEWVVSQLVKVYEKSMAGAPKIHNGVPVLMLVDGEWQTINEWSPSGANKALELLGRHLGMHVERHQIEGMGDVVYTLELDRELAAGDDDD